MNPTYRGIYESYIQCHMNPTYRANMNPTYRREAVTERRILQLVQLNRLDWLFHRVTDIMVGPMLNTFAALLR